MHGYNSKKSKDYMGCRESLYNEKEFDLCVLERFAYWQ